MDTAGARDLGHGSGGPEDWGLQYLRVQGVLSSWSPVPEGSGGAGDWGPPPGVQGVLRTWGIVPEGSGGLSSWGLVPGGSGGPELLGSST